MSYYTIYKVNFKDGTSQNNNGACFSGFPAYKINDVQNVEIYTLKQGKSRMLHSVHKDYDEYVDNLILAGFPISKGEPTTFDNKKVNTIIVDVNSINFKTQFLLTAIYFRYVYENEYENHTIVDIFNNLCKKLPTVDKYKLLMIAEWTIAVDSYSFGHRGAHMNVRSNNYYIPSTYANRYSKINQHSDVHQSYLLSSKQIAISPDELVTLRIFVKTLSTKEIIKYFKLVEEPLLEVA